MRKQILGGCLALGVAGASLADTSTPLLNAQSTIGDVLTHPKLQGFADKLLPWDNDRYDRTLPFARIGELMPYHSHFNTADMLAPLNAMIQSREQVFYDFYQGKVPHTGLFLFRGKPNAPTAVVSAGSGFQYVGSLHEAFPLAWNISKKGYNAVVVKYRAGVGAQAATEDLANAIIYLFDNQAKLKIDMRHYSLWGASASARMAAYIGSHGVQRFGVNNPQIPRPQTVVMLYTGHSDTSNNEPPTFVAVGEYDGIAPPSVMARRINRLKQQGVKTAFHRYPNLGHGFALGTDTSAQGWLDKAVVFWEEAMKIR
ncbi:acetyl esterase/lipase [Cricetibacter osteomyelitidis]|uniref:Acetyl esterase/lipase n=1 Tax=Cricetibacter osteomyelitidis TaxID=1521931 RepID=A0A4R2TM75_9PAST|nr:alpha/beta hydrolase [Cricetibacter osteomyelitidis]TCP95982.1 acetyl esterase/lipase [Cricetibacter osteomyelitidis]